MICVCEPPQIVSWDQYTRPNALRPEDLVGNQVVERALADRELSRRVSSTYEKFGFASDWLL